MIAAAERTPSGLSAVGPISWGAHFCHFYDDVDDLISVLVPFYKAGLEQNEQALWVAHKDMSADRARAALAEAVPDLSAREAEGQIAIVDHARWYESGGVFAAKPVLDAWVAGEAAALDGGRKGLRASGDTLWLTQENWRAFSEYEAKVTAAFRGRRLIALCSYCMGACGAGEVLDVVNTHDFAVARRDGEWQVIESAATSAAKAELAALNGALELRVRERTADLEKALASRDVLFREVHHRVRNNLQVIGSMLNLKARQIEDDRANRALTEMASRIHAMGLVHSALYDSGRDFVSVEMGAYLGSLARSLLTTFGAEDRVRVRLDFDGSTLPLAEATTVGLIAAELVINALRHAFAGRDGVLDLAWRTKGGACEAVVADDGPGLSAPGAQLARISGLSIVDGFARQLGGTLDRLDGPGARFRLRFPVRH